MSERDNGRMKITTEAELSGLPAESVLRDLYGSVLERHQKDSGELAWLTIGSDSEWLPEDVSLPALLLFDPRTEG